MDSVLSPATQRDQSEAILKLLSDDDPDVTALVLEQLGTHPGTLQARLEILLQKAVGPVRRVLLSEIERVKIGDPATALRECCHRLKTIEDFEDFCWKMCLYENPKAALFQGRERLDLLASRVSGELVDGAGPHEQLAALRLILAQEEGFRGNEENYYDPDNSFLDKVLQSHLGWPTSLTLVYMLVGHRARIQVEPVCFPGHFLARIGSCYFTPFSGAADIARAKLEETLSASTMSSDYDVLDQTPLPLMAQRMVNNLVSIYTKAEDHENLRRWQMVLIWLQEISI